MLICNELLSDPNPLNSDKPVWGHPSVEGKDPGPRGGGGVGGVVVLLLISTVD